MWIRFHRFKYPRMVYFSIWRNDIDSKKTAIEEIRKFMDHFEGEIDDVRFYKIAKDLVIFIKQLISEPGDE